MTVTETMPKGPAVFGKQAVKKPYIYVASNYAYPNRGSSLPLAEQIIQSPFVQGVFIAEGVYGVADLINLPYSVAITLAQHLEGEREMADLFVIDRQYGDPAELGFAVARGIPYIEYNPNKEGANPCFTGGAVLEVTDLETLADINYLKLVK